jgi:hypothetical protein
MIIKLMIIIKPVIFDLFHFFLSYYLCVEYDFNKFKLNRFSFYFLRLKIVEMILIKNLFKIIEEPKNKPLN